MGSKFLPVAALALGSAAVPGAASALVEEYEAPPVAMPETEDSDIISLTVRSSYTFTNLNVPNTSSIDQVVRSTMAMPSVGATVEFFPPGSSFSFAVSGFYGSTSGGLYGTNSGLNITGEYEVERLDAEALINYQVEDSPVRIFAGARYIGIDLTDTLAGNVVYGATGKNTNNEQIEYAALELGAGLGGGLDENSELTYFSNVIVGYGYAQFKSENGEHVTGGGSDHQYGPMGDMAVGLNYNPKDSPIGLSVRYRATFQPVHYAVETDTLDFWVTHGIELSASLRF